MLHRLAIGKGPIPMFNVIEYYWVYPSQIPSLELDVFEMFEMPGNFFVFLKYNT